jgi:hypothetical protein
VWWVTGYVGLGVLSIVFLGLLTLRLWRQVRQFGRDVAAAGERVDRALRDIDTASATRR